MFALDGADAARLVGGHQLVDLVHFLDEQGLLILIVAQDVVLEMGLRVAVVPRDVK